MVILSHGARKANKCIFRKETSIVTKSTQMKNVSVSLFQDGTQLWLNSSGTKCRTTRSRRAGVCVCKCAPSGGRLTNGNNKRSSPLISRQRLHGGSGGDASHSCRRVCRFRFWVFFIYFFVYFCPLAPELCCLRRRLKMAPRAVFCCIEPALRSSSSSSFFFSPLLLRPRCSLLRLSEQKKSLPFPSLLSRRWGHIQAINGFLSSNFFSPSPILSSQWAAVSLSDDVARIFVS